MATLFEWSSHQEGAVIGSGFHLHSKRVAMKTMKILPIALIMLATPVMAQDKQALTEPSLATLTGFYLAAGGYRHHYEETVRQAFFMSNKGPMRQVALAYTMPSRWQGMYWDVRWDFASGEIDYDSDGTGTLDGAVNNMSQLSFHVKHDIQLSSSMTFTPYYGVAQRLHEDNKQNLFSSTGASGYHRKSEYYYFPLGLQAQMRIASNVVLMPRMQWNGFYHGQQASDYTIINNQYIGYGYELGVDVSLAAGKGNIVLETTYKHWSIADSNITSYPENGGTSLAREPANVTSELGAMLGYRF